MSNWASPILVMPKKPDLNMSNPNKGKWKFHSLPFGINLGPSAFSYVLGKVLASCHKFALNYLDDIIIFYRTWQEHLEHLEEVLKQLKHADLNI